MSLSNKNLRRDMAKKILVCDKCGKELKGDREFITGEKGDFHTECLYE